MCEAMVRSYQRQSVRREPRNEVPSGEAGRRFVRNHDQDESERGPFTMPFFDPDYCEKRCPVCTRARQGNRVAKILQRIEWVVTFGGCPWCRARQRKYGVRPDEPLPKEGSKR
jgi:hypothetical protein